MDLDVDLDISFDSDNDNTGGDDNLTTEDVLKLMEESWINEKFAPEILRHKQDFVECLYFQIDEMEKNVQRLEKNDIRKCVHELELIRIRYLLSSYLRTRLMKIEAYADVILEEEQVRTNQGEQLYLTEAENTFAQTIKNLNQKYIINLFNFIPGFATDDSRDNPMRPNLNSYVFFQSKKTIDGVIVDDGVVDISADSKMIMSYSSVSHYLKNEEVQLI